VSKVGLTHEQFVHDVRRAAVAWARARGTITEAEAGRILAAKLVYGAGDGRYRGVCHYSAWANSVGPVEIVEIAAAGEESLVQVAGTTLHELGHVLAGWGVGHGAEWKRACERLGLRRALAAGQCYLMVSMAPEIRAEVARLAEGLVDGHPAFMAALSPVRVAPAPRPCPAGVGVKGGTSRARARDRICACGSAGARSRCGSGWRATTSGPIAMPVVKPLSSRTTFKRGHSQ